MEGQGSFWSGAVDEPQDLEANGTAGGEGEAEGLPRSWLCCLVLAVAVRFWHLLRPRSASHAPARAPPTAELPEWRLRELRPGLLVRAWCCALGVIVLAERSFAAGERTGG